MEFPFLRNEKSAKVMVIGDIMLDHYVHGKCDRISPEAPVPIVEIEGESFTLGGAGNVLKNLVAFGAEVSIIGVIGDDPAGAIVSAELRKAGIDASQVITCKGRVTTIKTRILAAKHQLIRLDKETKTDFSNKTEAKVIKKIRNCLSGFDVVLISDYSKGMIAAKIIAVITKECKKLGITTIVDPKDANFARYRGTDIIKPNRKEVAQATGIEITDVKTLNDACKAVRKTTHCNSVVVTLSEGGMAYCDGNTVIQIPTQATEIYDVTGAGDTVLAALGFAISKKAGLADACDFANHAAAVVIKKIGSATATLGEIAKSKNDIDSLISVP